MKHANENCPAMYKEAECICNPVWTEGTWEAKPSTDKSWVIMSGNIVIAKFQRKDKPEYNEANAKRICHCVNNFDTAPNAIRGFLKRWKRSGPQGSAQWEKFDAVISELRKAI